MLAFIFYRVRQSSLNVRARGVCGQESWDCGGGGVVVDDQVGSDKRRREY